MTKKILVDITILILLALDWAALHDILKANERDLIGEYGVLVFSVIVFAILIAWQIGDWRIQKRCEKETHERAHQRGIQNAGIPAS